MEFRVIKEDDLFYVSNVSGNIPQPSENQFGYGLYTKDTRVLSRLEWSVHPNVLLNLDADDSGNYQSVYRYTNREYTVDGTLVIPRECMLIQRRQIVDGRRLYEEGFVHNYSQQPISFDMSYILDADFSDMFEVRGVTREGKSRSIDVERGTDWIRFTHTASDGVKSMTTVRLSVLESQSEDAPSNLDVTQIENGNSSYGVSLSNRIAVSPGTASRWLLAVESTVDVENREHASTFMNASENDLEKSFQTSLTQIGNGYDEWLQLVPRVSGHAEFEQWYNRGINDIRMLLTDIGFGRFPVAGVPWFAVPFGRDSLIAALQLLMANPEVAKGTLATMAAHQGQNVSPTRDEQPGKIMHELRAGELTRVGEVPFGPYYGTIDATSLFLNLAAEYFAWTRDAAFIQTILPNVERAFAWLETYGDRDKDLFVEYYREASKGISNQGWKDSGDSVMHKDGVLAEAPIALCEVQGYTYRAYQRWADLYQQLGEGERSQRLHAKAKALQQRFIDAFWMEDENALALALDGEKKKVASISSNMGQVLWSGILPQPLADRLIHRLFQEDMFNGFGIRTLSAREVAYNPLSYHNGSIWPHDNSISIAGLQLYGDTRSVAKAVGGLLKTARAFPLMRLPELFSGFGVTEVNSPLPYPVSCSPQAWAAATPVMCLQALLGIQPEIAGNAVHLNPVLPDGVDELTVTGIRIGKGELDVVMKRASSTETTIHVQRNTTGQDIVLGTLIRR